MSVVELYRPLPLAELASVSKNAQKWRMANIVSLVFGVIALLLAIIGFIPFLGWMNWFIILIAAVGVAFGFASDRKSGRNFCLVVVAICVIRLWMGGGIF
jgi:uncharacterized membrane protein